MKKSHRNLISIFTLLFLVVIVIASRKEIIHALELLGQVDLWILALLIPLQFLSYYAAGEMMFVYLRDKGAMKKVSHVTTSRMALELNFVNHILPSGGVSGMSYMTWRLREYHITPGRATMAQIIRYMAGFLAFITLLIIAVVAITLDEGVNRVIILASTVIACLLIFSIIFSIYIISSRSRLHAFSRWVGSFLNSLTRKVTFGRKKTIVSKERIELFFEELHQDYIEIKKDKRILIKPYIWGLVFNFSEVAMFMVGFWALGHIVSPAPIVIAYGLAAFAGFVLITPGGAGGYEAIMVAFLATSGIAQGVAIASVVITRVVLLAGTIASGYIFYQLTLIRRGKHTT